MVMHYNGNAIVRKGFGGGGKGNQKGGGGGGNNPSFSQVAYLALGNSVTVDSSSHANVLTADSSVVVVSSPAPPFGTNCISYPGGGSGLRCPDQTWFTLGSSDFTFETFVRFNVIGGGTAYLIGGQAPFSGAASDTSLLMRAGTTGKLEMFSGSGAGYIGDIAGTTTLSINTWYYFAYGRQNNTFRLLLGTTPGGATSSEGSKVSAGSVNDSVSQFGLGNAGGYVVNTLNGYMFNTRLTVGTWLNPTVVPSALYPTS